MQLKKVTASSNVVPEYYDENIENQMINYSSTPSKKSRNVRLDELSYILKIN